MYLVGTTTQAFTTGPNLTKIGAAGLYIDQPAAPSPSNPATPRLVAKRILVQAVDATAGLRTLTLRRFDTQDPELAPAPAASTDFVFSWPSGTPLSAPYEINLDIDLPYGGAIMRSDANITASLEYVQVATNPAYELPETPYA